MVPKPCFCTCTKMCVVSSATSDLTSVRMFSGSRPGSLCVGEGPHPRAGRGGDGQQGRGSQPPAGLGPTQNSSENFAAVFRKYLVLILKWKTPPL